MNKAKVFLKNIYIFCMNAMYISNIGHISMKISSKETLFHYNDQWADDLVCCIKEV